MRKQLFLFLSILTLMACDKHDPILSGERIDVFYSKNLEILNERIDNLPDSIDIKNNDCPYTITADNTILDKNAKKIFSGFPTANIVDVKKTPVCNNGFVYAGLSTGELVKINPKNRNIIWIADIYRPSNMTGGAPIVDIISPVAIQNNFVYAGGLGNAFCKLSDSNGTEKWCIDLGTAHPFIVHDNVAFVVSTDDKINAIRLSDGAIYWQHSIKKQKQPIYRKKIIHVGNEKFNAETGEKI